MEINEEKRQKFMESAGKRVNNVMHDIQILEPMARSNVYDFTKEDVEQMFSAMQATLESTKSEFDKRFEEQNEKLDLHDKKLSLLDKKFDFLTNSYQENLEQHKQYDSNLSRINSKLFDHDMRIDSLEARSITATI